MAHFMEKNYAVAIQILESYQATTMEKDRPRPTYEESEMIMYKALLLESSGLLEPTLELLETSEADIVDVVGRREKMGEWDQARNT